MATFTLRRRVPPNTLWTQSQTGFSAGFQSGGSGPYQPSGISGTNATMLDVGVTQHLLSNLGSLPTPTLTKGAALALTGGSITMTGPQGPSTDFVQRIAGVGGGTTSGTTFSVVTFGTAYPTGSIMSAFIQPQTAGAYALGATITNLTTTGYTITVASTATSFVGYNYDVLILATFPLVSQDTGGLLGSFTAGITATATFPAAGSVAASFTASGSPITVIPATGGITASYVAGGSPVVSLPTSTSLAANFTASGSGIIIVPAAASLTASFSASASGVVQTPASGSLLATFSGSGTGNVGASGSGSLTGGFTASASVSLSAPTSGSLNTSFSANGTVSIAVFGSGGLRATFSATGAAGVVGPITAVQVFLTQARTMVFYTQPRAMTVDTQPRVMTFASQEDT